jgi:hypothetical protein
MSHHVKHWEGKFMVTSTSALRKPRTLSYSFLEGLSLAGCAMEVINRSDKSGQSYEYDCRVSWNLPLNAQYKAL